MTIGQIATCAGFVALVGAMIVTSEQPAQALTMKECSAKYQAAKSAGTLSGQNWRDFRKAQCGPRCDPPPAPGRGRAPAPTPRDSGPRRPEMPCSPTAISPKIFERIGGQGPDAHTCLDQYKRQQGDQWPTAV